MKAPVRLIAALAVLGCLLWPWQLKAEELLLRESVVYRAQGRQLQEAGEFLKAAASYRKAVEANPLYADAYNDLGVVLETLEDLRGAEAAYQRALELDPGLLAAHSNLGYLYEQMGRLPDASLQWGERILKGEPTDPWVQKAREKLAQYHLPIPKRPEEIVSDRRQQIRSAYEAAQAHLKAGRLDEAQREFEKLLALDPATSEARSGLREIEKKRGERQKERQRQIERSAAQAAQRLKAVEETHLKLEAQKRKEELGREQQEALRKREAAARHAEEARRAAEEARRKEELKRQQELRRQQELTRQQEIKQQQELKRQQELRRQEELKREQELKRQQQLKREQELKRQQEALKREQPPAPALKDAEALARELAREKLKTQRLSAQELYLRAISAMRGGRFEEAVTLFEQILALEPNHRQAQEGRERARKALKEKAAVGKP